MCVFVGGGGTGIGVPSTEYTEEKGVALILWCGRVRVWLPPALLIVAGKGGNTIRPVAVGPL